MKNSEIQPGVTPDHAQELRARLNQVKETADSLPLAAREDLEPKIERAETMLSALERDITEQTQEKGASTETTRNLLAELTDEMENLEREVDTLSLGNPTTVDAALDATARAVEKAGEAVKKLTSKVSVKSDS